jgi:hypothetical protein
MDTKQFLEERRKITLELIKLKELEILNIVKIKRAELDLRREKLRGVKLYK